MGISLSRDEPIPQQEAVFIVPFTVSLSMSQMTTMINSGQQPGVPFRLDPGGARRPEGQRRNITFSKQEIGIRGSSVAMTYTESIGTVSFSFTYDALISGSLLVFVGAREKSSSEITVEAPLLSMGPYPLVSGIGKQWQSSSYSLHIPADLLPGLTKDKVHADEYDLVLVTSGTTLRLLSSQTVVDEPIMRTENNKDSRSGRKSSTRRVRGPSWSPSLTGEGRGVTASNAFSSSLLSSSSSSSLASPLKRGKSRSQVQSLDESDSEGVRFEVTSVRLLASSKAVVGKIRPGRGSGSGSGRGSDSGSVNAAPLREASKSKSFSLRPELVGSSVGSAVALDDDEISSNSFIPAPAPAPAPAPVPAHVPESMNSSIRAAISEPGAQSLSQVVLPCRCECQKVETYFEVFILQPIFGLSGNENTENGRVGGGSDVDDEGEEDGAAAAAGDGAAQPVVDTDSSECVICLSDARTVVVYPCRHACMCLDCASSLPAQNNKCPMCRRPARLLVNIVSPSEQKSSSAGNEADDVDILHSSGEAHL